MYGTNENVIEWLKDQERATVSLTQRRMISTKFQRKPFKGILVRLTW